MDGSDYVDLFGALYDEVDAGAFRRSVERWLDDPAVEELAQRTSRDAARGELTAAGARAAVALAADADRARFGVLLGLDRAFAQIAPAGVGREMPPGLGEYASRYRKHGRLDTGRAGGGVLPRFVRPGRDAQVPSDLREAFAAVVRVSAEDWARADHLVLPPDGLFPRDDALVIGTTPLVSDPAELRWEVLRRNGRRFYRLYPADREATRRRIREVVRGFDAGGVQIGMAPEATLSPALLAEWQRALRERPDAERSALRFVLAGSGNVDEQDPPANTAVLLDGRTGEVLLRQRKLFRFSLYPEDLERWRLRSRLGPDAIDEDLGPGERVTIVETGWGRLAVLVCEDLARVPSLAEPLLAHNVSLLLVPVFARPTREHRWEHMHAQDYADSTGTTIVVANSLVMASLLGSPLPAGAALAVGPGGAVVAQAASAADVIRLELAAGAAPRLRPGPVPARQERRARARLPRPRLAPASLRPEFAR
jgi:predicted amidohydrolase